MCGTEYALTMTVTCEHTEQLPVIESDSEMSMVQRKICHRLDPCNLRNKNIFANRWKFDIKLPSIENRK
jgi:hypothetical protein